MLQIKAIRVPTMAKTNKPLFLVRLAEEVSARDPNVVPTLTKAIVPGSNPMHPIM